MSQYPPQPPQGTWQPSGPLSSQDPRKLQEPPQWQGPPPQPNTSYQQPSGPQWPPQQPFYTQPNNYQQPPPQYQRPPMMPHPGPPQPPKKKLSRRTWIALGIGVVVLIAFNALFNAAKNGDTPTATATATPTTIFVNFQATDTPPPPTPTSSALTDKAAIKGQLQSDISNLALVGDTISVDYADHAVVLVGENARPDEGYLVAMVQSECYDVQKTVWQDPLLQKVNWLDFSVFTVDSQGLPVILGECILHAQKATSIQWDNYDATSAWQQKIYENMLLQ